MPQDWQTLENWSSTWPGSYCSNLRVNIDNIVMTQYGMVGRYLVSSTGYPRACKRRTSRDKGYRHRRPPWRHERVSLWDSVVWSRPRSTWGRPWCPVQRRRASDRQPATVTFVEWRRVRLEWGMHSFKGYWSKLWVFLSPNSLVATKFLTGRYIQQLEK